MNYQAYIDLGFKRIDMNDSIEFAETGFYGYSLEKTINDKLSIAVCSGELNRPKLYIKKSNEDNYHIVQLTCTMIKDLLSETNNTLNIC